MLELYDNSPACKAAIDAATLKFLYEVAGELASQAQRNSRVATGQTKNSYGYYVNEDVMSAVVGSTEKNAIWEEFGTGQYALAGNGRKGGWWIKVGNGKDEIPMKTAQRYRWAGYRYENDDVSYGKKLRQSKSRGRLTYVFTYGKKPNRPLFRASQRIRGRLKRMMEQHLRNEVK